MRDLDGRSGKGRPRASFTVQQAEALLAQQLVAVQTVVAPRRAVQPLLELLDARSEDPVVRYALVTLVLNAQSQKWRTLYQAWQLAGAEDPRIAVKLTQRVGTALLASARFQRRLPRWMRKGETQMLASKLRAPVEYLTRLAVANTIPIETLKDEWDLSERRFPLRNVLRRLLVPGHHHRWWGSMARSSIRDWATSVGDLELRGHAANRMLLDSPAAGSDADGRGLLLWVLEALGDPELRPGNWLHVSAEGRDAFERLYLSRELDRILAEFRRHATDDGRANYWQRKFNLVRDARYYKAKGTAVCMMVIGSELVIEFGDTGNACYFYAMPAPPRRLRALKIPTGLGPSDFKSRNAIELGDQDFFYRNKLSHHTRWTSNFDTYLRYGH